MTVPTFTPGDWIADEKRLVIETADHALDVAQVFDDGSCPTEQLKADLHVLAASKVLYAAARDVLLGLCNMTTESFRNGGDAQLRDVLQKALQKAEGR